MIFNNSIQKNKSAFFWNSISSVLSSFQSAIILAIISHTTNEYDAGIFVFAYTSSNLMMVIGKFGLRQFQVSDITNKYNFSDYLLSRKITSILMLIVSFFYAFLSGDNDFEKTLTFLLWCGIRIIEAYEDVYHGDLQKNHHLDKAAKALCIRLLASLIIFSCSYYWGRNLIISYCITLILEFILALFLNIHLKNLYSPITSTNICRVKKLLYETSSLFLSYFCTMYLSNAPKYSINGILSNEMQAIYGYLFMPVFLVNLLCNFIMQPLVVTYTKLWNQNKLRKLCQMIGIHLGIIILATSSVILVGKSVGIRLLETLYNTSLLSYSHILYILLIASGLIALLSYFKTLLTIIRCQNILFVLYLIGCLLMILGNPYALAQNGILGITIYYTTILSLLDASSFVLFLYKIYQKKKFSN